MSTHPTSPQKQFPIVCRVNPKSWWIVVLGTLEAAFLFYGPIGVAATAPHPDRWWLLACLSWPVSLLFSLGIVWTVFELIRGEIRADESGLTWRRGFGNWKSARWQEVSDYYIPRYAGERIVETPQGKLGLSGSFLGIQKIVDLVPTYAINATTRQWGRQGFRHEDDWSLSLSTWSKAQHWTAPIMTALMVSGVLSFLGLLRFPQESTIQRHDAFAVGTMAMLCGPIGLLMMWLVFTLWRERHFAWQHRDETLVLNSQGLVFSSTPTPVEAKWEELRSIERLPPQNKFPRVLVGTVQGDFVIWALPNSTMWQQFRRLAQEYAPWSTEALLKKEAQEPFGAYEDLDGPHGAWSGPQIGEGARVFSVRSRSNRLILLCASIALLFAPCLYLITLYSSANDELPFAPHWPIFWGACLSVVLVMGSMFLWFKRTSVWVDGEGLLVHWPLRAPRRVRWAEIEVVGRDAWGDWVRTANRKIYFTFLLPQLRHKELLELIQTHTQRPHNGLEEDDLVSS